LSHTYSCSYKTHTQSSLHFTYFYPMLYPIISALSCAFSIRYCLVHCKLHSILYKCVIQYLDRRRIYTDTSDIPLYFTVCTDISANTHQVPHTIFPHRTTGCGFMCATYRLGGILGNVTFSNLVGASRAVPMLTTAVVLLFGGLVSLKLPETHTALL